MTKEGWHGESLREEDGIDHFSLCQPRQSLVLHTYLPTYRRLDGCQRQKREACHKSSRNREEIENILCVCDKGFRFVIRICLEYGK